MAPANSWPTDSGSGAKLPMACWATWLAPCRISPMKISTVEGGMIWPKVPDAQITPEASFGS